MCDTAKTPETAYTVEYLLTKLAELQSDTAHLHEALARLSHPAEGDSAAAIGDIVRCRETTNQQLIQLYEKMYDQLSGSRDMMQRIAQSKWQAIESLAAAALIEDEYVAERSGIVDTVRQILRENP